MSNSARFEIKNTLQTLNAINSIKGMHESLMPQTQLLKGMTQRDVLMGRDAISSLNKLHKSFVSESLLLKNSSIRDSLMGRDAINSLSKLHKSIVSESLLLKSASIRDSLMGRDVINSLHGLRRSAASESLFLKSTSLRDSLKVIEANDSMRALRDSILIQSQSSIGESLRNSLKILGDVSSIGRSLQSLNSTQVNESIESIFNSLETLSDDRIGLQAEDVANVNIDHDGQISLGDDSIAEDELKFISIQIMNSAFTSDEESLAEKLDRLIELISSQKNSFIQKLLWMLIPSIMVGMVFLFLNPIGDFYIKESLTKNDKKHVVKEVRAKVLGFDPSGLIISSFRIVSADMLNVRLESTKKSPVVGILYLGSVVEVLEKRRNWTLVSWQSGDIAMQGWVYSRYLKKLR